MVTGVGSLCFSMANSWEQRSGSRCASEQFVDSAREATPAEAASFESPTAVIGQRVDLSRGFAFLRHPLRDDPAFVLQTMEDGVKLAVLQPDFALALRFDA